VRTVKHSWIRTGPGGPGREVIEDQALATLVEGLQLRVGPHIAHPLLPLKADPAADATASEPEHSA